MQDLRALPRRAVRGAALLALTAASGGSLAAAMALAPEKKRYETRDRITHAWASGLLDLFGVTLEMHGAKVGHRGVGARGRVVVANHRSVIDIAVLLSLFGGAVLSRADLATWPVIGPGARAAGTIFVERGDRTSGEQAVRAMVERLAAHDTISVFPEGTTFVDDEVRPFKAGAFAAAMRAEVPVVPVGLVYPGEGEGFGDESFLAHMARLADTKHTRVGVGIGEPLVPLEGESIDAFRERTRAEVAALVREARMRLDGQTSP